MLLRLFILLYLKLPPLWFISILFVTLHSQARCPLNLHLKQEFTVGSVRRSVFLLNWAHSSFCPVASSFTAAASSSISVLVDGCLLFSLTASPCCFTALLDELDHSLEFQHWVVFE